MARFNGSSTSEIDAPIARVWALVEDVEKAPEWQGGLVKLIGTQRDAEGRAVLCDSENDVKVRTVKSVIRFTYDGPTRLSWRQERGELKGVDGSWELEELAPDRTRATYRIEVEIGGMLAMVARGPMVNVLTDMLAGARAGELKRAVEAGD
jgi:carbon monoxide dehydrogenase subunit G